MGLDMYLYKKTYVKNYNFMGEDEKHEVTVKKGGEVSKDIKPERVSHIVEEVGYWRKANEIHKWFVDNVQDGVDDCKEYYVPEEKLKELLELVCKVLRSGGKKAPVLLPTQSGFFFGGTDYDEYYFEDLKHTKKVLQTALKEGGDYYYESSW